MLLIGGPANDGGFYQAMVDGLKTAAAKDGNITVEVREKLASGGDAAMDDAVRQAAAGGDFDLVVAHGFDLVPYVAKYATEFPDQKFATSLPVDGNPANTEVYLSVFEQIGYNAGFLASQGTTAKKIGFIGGPGLPFEKQAEAGFKEAVAKYAPGADVSVVYTGTFEDPQLAQETTTQMIADGVDSIWNQQAAGQSGVYTACAAAPQVNCFGNSPYSEAVSPAAVLASTVSDYGILLPEWAKRLRTNAWTIGPDMLDQKGGGTAITDATAAGQQEDRRPAERHRLVPGRYRRREGHGDARTAGMTPLLALRDISKRFGSVEALDRGRPRGARRRGARRRRRERRREVDARARRGRAGDARLRARSSSTAGPCASPTGGRRPPRGSAWCTSTSAWSTRSPPPRTSSWGGPAPKPSSVSIGPAPTCGRGPSAPACRSTPTFPSGRCRSASASASRSCRPWRGARGCCCSTSRRPCCRRSKPTACSPWCAPSPTTGWPSSSSPTSCARWKRWPTGPR